MSHWVYLRLKTSWKVQKQRGRGFFFLVVYWNKDLLVSESEFCVDSHWQDFLLLFVNNGRYRMTRNNSFWCGVDLVLKWKTTCLLLACSPNECHSVCMCKTMPVAAADYYCSWLTLYCPLYQALGLTALLNIRSHANQILKWLILRIKI